MIAICKKDNTKLIKGQRYEVQAMYLNSGGNRISIKGYGLYSINSFSDINGNDLPLVAFNNYVRTENTKIEDIKEGDILVCTRDNYKILLNGGKYKIEKIIVTEKKYGTGRSWFTHHLKFVGISRRIKFNPWCFRKLDTNELREMSLANLLDNEEIKIMTTTKFRKIDLVEDKDEVLLKIISKSILDVSRHHLGVIDWSCRKLGNKYSIEQKDFGYLMNMTFKEVLELIN